MKTLEVFLAVVSGQKSEMMINPGRDRRDKTFLYFLYLKMEYKGSGGEEGRMSERERECTNQNIERQNFTLLGKGQRGGGRGIKR